MTKFKISNDYISKCNDTDVPQYPKYTTQVINLANQNAGGTRPRNVGQLSELLPEYLSLPGEASLSGWREWYNERYPDAVENAVDKIWTQVNNLRDCMDYIDKPMVKTWVEDLIYNKTFNGLYYQKAILQKISELEGKPFRLANPNEEAMNIDGFVGDTAYQIKPDTYDHMKYGVHEEIPCTIVKYRKTSTGIEVEY